MCGSKLLAVKVRYRRGREKDETHPKQSKIYKVYKYYGNPNEWSNEKDELLIRKHIGIILKYLRKSNQIL